MSFFTFFTNFFSHHSHEETVDGGTEELEIIDKDLQKVAEYCENIIFVGFFGQTNSFEETDHTNTKNVLHLGLYLSLLDKCLRKYECATEFDPNDEEFCCLLKVIAEKRKKVDETTDQCYQKLLRDSKRFAKIYKERTRQHKDLKLSEALEHEEYWGTRQQLLAGKVICDWLNVDHAPMDPIFGVLLNPTAGRVGPGDTGFFHDVMFDDFGKYAYHSAVHDGFGYLLNFHSTGPGYDYMKHSLFSTKNPLAGQFSGLDFWKDHLEKVEDKLKMFESFRLL